jgi:hypothetical protein
MKGIPLVLVGISLAALAGCATQAITPTYTQEELRNQCERAGNGVWHPDALMGGFCEWLHS